jgi:hypothetical protein
MTEEHETAERAVPTPAWTRQPRLATSSKWVAGMSPQPSLPDSMIRNFHPAASTLATPFFGPKYGVHFTILNRIEKHPSFVYERVELTEKPKAQIEVLVRARAGSRPVCSGCLRRGRTYDHLTERRFNFVPLWGIPVIFKYRMRRVDCSRCAVTVELLPWSDGKSPVTTTYAWFLARWAKKLSWKDVSESFQTSWHSVFRSVELAVAWRKLPHYAHTWKLDIFGVRGRARYCVGGILPSESCGRFSL